MVGIRVSNRVGNRVSNRVRTLKCNPYKSPSVPYSGSGNPTALQASTIRLTPVPQLSKKAVIYKAAAAFFILSL